jgi:hypothetical protein
MNAASRRLQGSDSKIRSRPEPPPPDFPLTSIASRILLLRGQKVMLDADLAALYGVETRTLVQGVKRNLARFPADFMYQLKATEFRDLRSQSVISSGLDSRGWGGRRSPPYAFTEQGVAMLSSVLRSTRAIEVNVAIMRTFVRLREVLASDLELARRLNELASRIEKKLSTHDQAIAGIFEAIRQLMQPPQGTSRPIGFVTPKEGRNKPSGRTTRRE